MNRRESFKATLVGLAGALWPWGAIAKDNAELRTEPTYPIATEMESFTANTSDRGSCKMDRISLDKPREREA